MGSDMIEVVCRRPEVTQTGPDRVRLSATITIAGVARQLWFEVPEGSVPDETISDAFALASLLPALRVAERLVVEGPISPLLRRNLEELQGLFTAWFPEFHRVEIDAPALEGVSPAPDTAAFFSGGVDSFYTAITRADDLDSLIYVDGLDMVAPTPEFRGRVLARIEAAASELGHPLARVTTNLRPFSEPYSDWLTHFHAVALACVAHATGGRFGLALVSADRTYGDLFPWAAHPLVIHLCASDRTRFEPVGWTTPRVDRVARISQSPVAMRHLRVCWESRDEAYNCGECGKCLRTKSALVIAGALDRCATMDDALDLETFAAREYTHTGIAYIIDSIPRAEAAGLDDLTAALRRIVDGYRMRKLRSDIENAYTGLQEAGDDAAEFVTRHREALYAALDAHHGRWLTARVLRDLPQRAGRKVRSKMRAPRSTERRSAAAEVDEPQELPPAGVEGILLATPGGNTGDELIGAGSERFLRRAELDVWRSDGSIERAVERGDHRFLRAALEGFTGIVFLPGGGNIGIYPENARLRAAVIASASNARGFLVLPQSCFRTEETLRQDGVTVWARESASHRVLEAAGVTTRLVPDASFAMVDTITPSPGGEGTFFILRAPGTCEERVEHTLTVDGPADDLTFALPLGEIETRLGPWGTVVSDRLHGGLIAIMMRKPTALLPVAYHKNASVYETWFADDPGVGFVTSQPELDALRDELNPPETDLAALFAERASAALVEFLDGTVAAV